MFDREKIEELRKEKEEWEETQLKKTLDRFPERKSQFSTVSDIPVDRVYTPLDVEGLDYLEDLGLPGEFPFTRNVYPTAYRGRLWTMRQYSGFGTAKETNERFKYLLDQGQTGLSVAFDLPTQMGYDSDHDLSIGEVGKTGVAIDTLDDMERLFDGIPLEKVSTSMTINSPAAILLAMYVAVAEKQGADPSDLAGTIQNDILKEYVARNTFIFPPEPSMRIVNDIFEYCSENMPRWNTISVSGYHIRESGANAVQELAFTLANGIAYVQAAVDAGLNVDDFAPRVSFFFAADNNLLEEVAKFRAARRLWARIMRDRFGAEDPRSCMLRYHVQTAGSALTAQQPINNIVRVAFHALAAVLGGTQSLHTNSYDEALALPSEEAVRTALRTQQIIAHETGVADTIDPLAGSYYVESLTDEIEDRVMEYIDKIDKIGGVLQAIDNGFIQMEIQESAYKHQKEVDSGDQIIVGVNEFEMEEEDVDMDLHKADPEVERAQKERLEQVKTDRDDAEVQDALEEVRGAAQGDDNLIPPIIRAVKAYATIGEITDVLRDEFGEYRGSVML